MGSVLTVRVNGYVEVGSVLTVRINGYVEVGSVLTVGKWLKQNIKCVTSSRKICKL